MQYTGFERCTDNELIRAAHASYSPLASELAKRLDAKNHTSAWTREDEDEEAAALAGVNPIPLNTGDEL